MGGQLVLNSTPGRGSAFTFALPLEAGATEHAPRTAPRVSGYIGPRRRLLIVDDLAINRAVLREFLAPLGFECEETGSGEAALAAAGLRLPDLVFLDLRLQGEDGLATARLFRAAPQLRGAKLIAISASVLSFNRDEVFAAGFDDYLPKPFHEADLLECVRRHLGLEWIAAEPAAPQTGETPQPADLRDLLQLARLGDVLPLRARLEALCAAYPGTALWSELHGLARTYQLSRLRERLEASLPPETSSQ